MFNMNCKELIKKWWFWLIVILLIAVFIIKQGPLLGNHCDWRPTRDNYGPCDMLLGIYYNGEECVSISGCNTYRDEIPFKTIEECKVLCEK